MQSNINLNIEIKHDDNLPGGPDAAEYVARLVASTLASTFGLASGRLTITDGRMSICGPVEVRLQSAAVTRRAEVPQ